MCRNYHQMSVIVTPVEDFHQSPEATPHRSPTCLNTLHIRKHPNRGLHKIHISNITHSHRVLLVTQKRMTRYNIRTIILLYNPETDMYNIISSSISCFVKYLTKCIYTRMRITAWREFKAVASQYMYVDVCPQSIHFGT